MAEKKKTNVVMQYGRCLAIWVSTLGTLLTATSVEAQEVYRNLAFGIVVTAPPGYVQCKFKSETDHGAIFVKGTAETCNSGQRAENHLWVSAWHSQAGDIDDLPPIRRAIAADKCKPTPYSKILAFDQAKRSVSGLPSFFCATELRDAKSGKREYLAQLIFFRGTAPPPIGPYPIYEYTLAVGAPPAEAAYAKRLLFETARRVRLLPID
jgi:hypothetical protein